MCLVFPVQRNTAESMYHLIRRLSISRKRDACRMWSYDSCSDSHTRYGALGTMAIGEGGGELAKQLLKRTYDVAKRGLWQFT